MVEVHWWHGENKLKSFIDKINKVYHQFLRCPASLIERVIETDLYAKYTYSHQY